MSDDEIPSDEDEAASSPETPSGPALHVPEGIRIFPNVWPGAPLEVQPGDVTQFAPMGFCFGGPIIMRPWDTLESAVGAGGYYGARGNGFHPLRDAPLTEPGGGVLYFDSWALSDTVVGALNLMGAHMRGNQFAVFVTEATEPQREGFLVHCRIMPFGTVSHLYHANLELIEGCTNPQPMNLENFVRGFIDLHKKRYGTGMCSELYGAMGGDGDWAKEALCFGFMMENAYHGICRIWTRAWLVTK